MVVALSLSLSKCYCFEKTIGKRYLYKYNILLYNKVQSLGHLLSLQSIRMHFAWWEWDTAPSACCALQIYLITCRLTSSLLRDGIPWQDAVGPECPHLCDKESVTFKYPAIKKYQHTVTKVVEVSANCCSKVALFHLNNLFRVIDLNFNPNQTKEKPCHDHKTSSKLGTSTRTGILV